MLQHVRELIIRAKALRFAGLISKTCCWKFF